jgi:hypothetical protein
MTGELSCIIVKAGIKALRSLPKEKQIELLGAEYHHIEELYDIVYNDSCFLKVKKIKSQWNIFTIQQKSLKMENHIMRLTIFNKQYVTGFLTSWFIYIFLNIFLKILIL